MSRQNCNIVLDSHMGRFIVLQELTGDEIWVLPKELQRWDRRYQPEPWPNDLFPYYVDWYWGNDRWSWKTKTVKIHLRRFVEQKCLGDVDVGPVSADNTDNTSRLWFEHEGDQVLTKLTWSEYVLP